MFAKTILAAAATVLLSAITTTTALPVANPEANVLLGPLGLDPECIDGVRVIVARGSTTPQDQWTPLNSMGAFVSQGFANSENHNLYYPATLDNYEYSESYGVNNLTYRITSHIDNCPNQRFALIGYSQGAQVIADTLIGYVGTRGQGLAPKYRNNIVAVVQFGDPTFVPGLSFDAGTASLGGIIPRDNADQYYSYGFAPRMKSWCDWNDSVCASGDSVAVHTSYFANHIAEAQDWMRSIIPPSITG